MNRAAAEAASRQLIWKHADLAGSLLVHSVIIVNRNHNLDREKNIEQTTSEKIVAEEWFLWHGRCQGESADQLVVFSV